jgi:hypothetical protein
MINATEFANKCADLRRLFLIILRNRIATEKTLSILEKSKDAEDSIRNLFLIKPVMSELEKSSEILREKGKKVNEFVRIVNDLISSYEETHPAVEPKEPYDKAAAFLNEIDSLAEKRMKELPGISTAPQSLKY